MATGEVVKSLNVALYVQPGGPNTPVRYLGCHTIGSVTKPKGTNTLNHCPDPVNPGRYKVSSKVKAPPGLVTFTIESKVYQVFDALENLNCPVPLIAQVVSCAPKNQFNNWDRAFIFVNADNVQEGLSNLVSGGADNNEVMQSFDMEADDMIRLVPLVVSRDSSIGETQALNAVFACDQDICAGPCGAANEQCDTLYAVGDAVSGSAAGTANVWIMSDDTWSAAAADPFGADENISAGTCFALTRNTRRLLVFRGTTDPSAPAEAAYSDDGGATWTTVNIGSDNGEYVPNAHSVSTIDQNNIWVGTDSGRIYFSNDGGGSWTVQEDAGIHTAAWNWIRMIDDRNGFAGGAGDVIATTNDGGSVWSQANATGQGGDITSGAVLDSSTAWVGTDDGEIFYTTDGGTTWTQRSGWVGSGIGQVKSMMFVNNMVGYMVVNNNSNKATFLQTRNGGYSWETVDTPTNSGVNSIMACGNRLVYGVGEASNGTPVIYKLQPRS